MRNIFKLIFVVYICLLIKFIQSGTIFGVGQDYFQLLLNNEDEDLSFRIVFQTQTYVPKYGYIIITPNLVTTIQSSSIQCSMKEYDGIHNNYLLVSNGDCENSERSHQICIQSFQPIEPLTTYEMQVSSDSLIEEISEDLYLGIMTASSSDSDAIIFDNNPLFGILYASSAITTELSATVSTEFIPGIKNPIEITVVPESEITSTSKLILKFQAIWGVTEECSACYTDSSISDALDCESETFLNAIIVSGFSSLYSSHTITIFGILTPTTIDLSVAEKEISGYLTEGRSSIGIEKNEDISVSFKFDLDEYDSNLSLNSLIPLRASGALSSHEGLLINIFSLKWENIPFLIPEQSIIEAKFWSNDESSLCTTIDFTKRCWIKFVDLLSNEKFNLACHVDDTNKILSFKTSEAIESYFTIEIVFYAKFHSGTENCKYSLDVLLPDSSEPRFGSSTMLTISNSFVSTTSPIISEISSAFELIEKNTITFSVSTTPSLSELIVVIPYVEGPSSTMLLDIGTTDQELVLIDEQTEYDSTNELFYTIFTYQKEDTTSFTLEGKCQIRDIDLIDDDSEHKRSYWSPYQTFWFFDLEYSSSSDIVLMDSFPEQSSDIIKAYLLNSEKFPSITGSIANVIINPNSELVDQASDNIQISIYLGNSELAIGYTEYPCNSNVDNIVCYSDYQSQQNKITIRNINFEEDFIDIYFPIFIVDATSITLSTVIEKYIRDIDDFFPLEYSSQKIYVNEGSSEPSISLSNLIVTSGEPNQFWIELENPIEIESYELQGFSASLFFQLQNEKSSSSLGSFVCGGATEDFFQSVESFNPSLQFKNYYNETYAFKDKIEFNSLQCSSCSDSEIFYFIAFPLNSKFASEFEYIICENFEIKFEEMDSSSTDFILRLQSSEGANIFSFTSLSLSINEFEIDSIGASASTDQYSHPSSNLTIGFTVPTTLNCDYEVILEGESDTYTCLCKDHSNIDYDDPDSPFMFLEENGSGYIEAIISNFPIGVSDPVFTTLSIYSILNGMKVGDSESFTVPIEIVNQFSVATASIEGYYHIPQRNIRETLIMDIQLSSQTFWNEEIQINLPTEVIDDYDFEEHFIYFTVLDSTYNPLMVKYCKYLPDYDNINIKVIPQYSLPQQFRITINNIKVMDDTICGNYISIQKSINGEVLESGSSEQKISTSTADPSLSSALVSKIAISPKTMGETATYTFSIQDNSLSFSSDNYIRIIFPLSIYAEGLTSTSQGLYCIDSNENRLSCQAHKNEINVYLTSSIPSSQLFSFDIKNIRNPSSSIDTTYFIVGVFNSYTNISVAYSNELLFGTTTQYTISLYEKIANTPIQIISVEFSNYDIDDNDSVSLEMNFVGVESLSSSTKILIKLPISDFGFVSSFESTALSSCSVEYYEDEDTIVTISITQCIMSSNQITITFGESVTNLESKNILMSVTGINIPQKERFIGEIEVKILSSSDIIQSSYSHLNLYKDIQLTSSKQSVNVYLGDFVNHMILFKGLLLEGQVQTLDGNNFVNIDTEGYVTVTQQSSEILLNPSSISLDPSTSTQTFTFGCLSSTTIGIKSIDLQIYPSSEYCTLDLPLEVSLKKAKIYVPSAGTIFLEGISESTTISLEHGPASDLIISFSLVAPTLPDTNHFELLLSQITFSKGETQKSVQIVSLDSDDISLIGNSYNVDLEISGTDQDSYEFNNASQISFSIQEPDFYDDSPIITSISQDYSQTFKTQIALNVEANMKGILYLMLYQAYPNNQLLQNKNQIQFQTSQELKEIVVANSTIENISFRIIQLFDSLQNTIIFGNLVSSSFYNVICTFENLEVSTELSPISNFSNFSTDKASNAYMLTLSISDLLMDDITLSDIQCLLVDYLEVIDPEQILDINAKTCQENRDDKTEGEIEDQLRYFLVNSDNNQNSPKDIIDILSQQNERYSLSQFLEDNYISIESISVSSCSVETVSSVPEIHPMVIINDDYLILEFYSPADCFIHIAIGNCKSFTVEDTIFDELQVTQVFSQLETDGYTYLKKHIFKTNYIQPNLKSESILLHLESLSLNEESVVGVYYSFSGVDFFNAQYSQIKLLQVPINLTPSETVKESSSILNQEKIRLWLILIVFSVIL